MKQIETRMTHMCTAYIYELTTWNLKEFLAELHLLSDRSPARETTPGQSWRLVAGLAGCLGPLKVGIHDLLKLPECYQESMEVFSEHMQFDVAQMLHGAGKITNIYPNKITQFCR